MGERCPDYFPEEWVDSEAMRQGEMDPQTVAHIVDVVQAVKTASLDLPTETREGLIQRRAAVRRAKSAPLRPTQHGRRDRLA